MFQAAKGFKKEDLLFVAEEIGATLPQKVTISELKEAILKSKQYSEDPQFVEDILVTTVSDRKHKELAEADQKRLEYEEKQKQLECDEKQKQYEERERIRLHELELARIQVNSPVAIAGESENSMITSARRKFNLPKLEFRQFSGDIKEWLPFWSQFQQIHQDVDIAPENKFQYLIQATVSGSRAREVVESFPPTGANYAKVIDSLKARFGRDELLVEVYVRELLRLIISVQKNEKILMTSLYDKLESYLRALETLGVTTDKCASILYPMVESCFQEEFLKAWNRSPSYAASTDAKERLNNLMNFLKTETEGEERINLAMAGFGLGSSENRQTFKKKGKPLISGRVQLCVFCSGKHSSSDCFTAQRMSLAERQDIKKAQFLKSGTLDKLGFGIPQKPLVEASFKVAYHTAKSKKPHTFGETLIKPCALEMFELVCRL
nr:uncharacterized protein LOC122269427 [Parasteatoda tepidariorum]